jgi:glutamyl-tRNA synthetase
MGWQVPVMAHIPLIHGPDGAKLSKRHGALGAQTYRAMGYLPEAMRNYLARLGWSHGDDEIMTTGQMIEWFDIADINKGAARFDIRKLEALNGHYVRSADDGYLLRRIEQILPEIKDGPALAAKLDDEKRARLLAAMPGLKERAKTLVQLIESAYYLFADRPLELDQKAAAILDEDARALLAEAHDALVSVAPWDAEHLEAAIRAFAEDKGLKLGRIAQPLRAALTGRATSPGVFDVLAVLGREESLARLGDCIS